MNSLPIKITFADREGRVRFYSRSRIFKGFDRVRDLLGRRLEHCHPPKLEPIVRKVFESLKSGARDRYELYTRIGGRTVKVWAIAVRDEDGEFLGVLEAVEDLTEALEKPEEVERRIQVL